MSRTNWELFDRISADPKSLDTLASAFMGSVAERLEEAVCSASRLPLEAIASQLSGLVRKVISQCPPSVAEAVRPSSSTTVEAERAAFLLGQLSLAQQFASLSLERRASHHFVDTIRNNRFAPIVQALVHQDETNTALAGLLDQCEETISRKLSTLRRLGICDFRKDGTKVLNFLTPAARAVAGEMLVDSKRTPIGKNEGNSERERFLASLRNGLPDPFRSNVNFSAANLEAFSLSA